MYATEVSYAGYLDVVGLTSAEIAANDSLLRGGAHHCEQHRPVQHTGDKVGQSPEQQSATDMSEPW